MYNETTATYLSEDCSTVSYKGKIKGHGGPDGFYMCQ